MFLEPFQPMSERLSRCKGFVNFGHILSSIHVWLDMNLFYINKN